MLSIKARQRFVTTSDFNLNGDGFLMKDSIPTQQQINSKKELRTLLTIKIDPGIHGEVEEIQVIAGDRAIFNGIEWKILDITHGQIVMKKLISKGKPSDFTMQDFRDFGRMVYAGSMEFIEQ